MFKFLCIALIPALVILGVLTALFGWVGHVEGITDPLPWVFILGATGFTLLCGVGAAVVDVAEGR